MTTRNNLLSEKRPDLAKEWHPTKNGELTPDVVTVASGRKVWWKCDKGHEWKTTIANRKKGTNCPYCAGQKVCSDNSLNTLNPKIAQEWNYNKNKNLTPNDVTEKSSRKVWWKCEKGHEWEAIIYNRNNGGGCPYCNNNGTSFPEQAIYFYIKQIFKDAVNTHILKVDGKKIEIDIFIPSLNLGIEYDGFFYHKTRVKNDSYKNKKLENKIILVRIREHGLPKLDSKKVKYIQRVNNKRTSLQYDIEKLFDFIKKMDISHELKSKMFSTKINLTKDRYKIIEMSKHLFKNVSLLSRNPLLVKEWHPVKNEGLVPKNFTCFSNVKVWWKCSKGHEWEATISNRNNGTNCPYCTGKRVCLDNSLATLNPKIAQEWNYIKNKSLTPSDVTERSCRKVWWKCDKGHEWVATIYSRNSGCGCPYCSGRLACPNNSLAFLNPKLAEEWHPVKNKNLSPENVKTGSSKKVWWKCSKGHEWEAVIYSRNKGIGCPYCHKKRRLIS